MALVDQPERLAQLVALKAAGLSDNQTAKEMGLAHSTVGRLTKREEIRTLIEATHERLLTDTLDGARANVTDVIASYPRYEKAGDVNFAKLALKYSGEILRSIGALPAVAPSQLAVNIVNSGQVVLSPLVQQVINQVSDRLAAPPDSED